MTAFPKPTKKARVARKRSERAERNARVSAIRQQAISRCRGFGELCGKPLHGEAEMCHLDGGSGKRRQKESIENVLMEHVNCHDLLDAHPLSWLGPVREWAQRNGYPVPARFRKLEALRG